MEAVGIPIDRSTKMASQSIAKAIIYRVGCFTLDDNENMNNFKI